jgi:hypothetical protein
VKHPVYTYIAHSKIWQRAAGWAPLLNNIDHDQPPVALEISIEPSVSVLVLLFYSFFS